MAFFSKMHFQRNRAVALRYNSIVDWKTKVAYKKAMCRMNSYLYSHGSQLFLFLFLNKWRVCLSHVSRRLAVVLCPQQVLGQGQKGQYIYALSITVLQGAQLYCFICSIFSWMKLFLCSLPFLDFFWHFSSSSALFFSLM